LAKADLTGVNCRELTFIEQTLWADLSMAICEERAWCVRISRTPICWAGIAGRQLDGANLYGSEGLCSAGSVERIYSTRCFRIDFRVDSSKAIGDARRSHVVLFLTVGMSLLAAR